MSLVPCEPTGSSFSTPGFTPGSLPVRPRFQVQLNLTPSHSIPVSTDRPFRAMLPSHHCSHLPQPASSEMWCVAPSEFSSCAPAVQADISLRFLQRYAESSPRSNGAILARHMPLLNDKLASFMDELGSRLVIEAQQ